MFESLHTQKYFLLVNKLKIKYEPMVLISPWRFHNSPHYFKKLIKFITIELELI